MWLPLPSSPVEDLIQAQTLKFWAQNKAECLLDDPIGQNAKFFQKGGFRSAFEALNNIFLIKSPPPLPPAPKKGLVFEKLHLYLLDHQVDTQLYFGPKILGVGLN